jgi:hypothetical protein
MSKAPKKNLGNQYQDGIERKLKIERKLINTVRAWVRQKHLLKKLEAKMDKEEIL